MALREKSKSRFQYHEFDTDETRKAARESGRRYETPFKPGFDIYTPPTGHNTIRLLPPGKPSKTPGFFIRVHS